MTPHFERVAFRDIEDEVRCHLATLPSAMDSFLEDHILGSRHYRVAVDEHPAGFTSIHGGSLITQFALTEPWRHLGQPIFRQVRRLEEAQAAFVPTSDEFYLAHALDDYRQLAKQAYFFAAGDRPHGDLIEGISLRLAELPDAEIVRQESGDFFDPVERFIERQELFVTMCQGVPVGFGLRVRSALYDAVASIGMFTIEQFRRQGVGTATIALLIGECRQHSLQPVAGCWYYNHRSKQTLERAGMYSPTRLLKVEY